MNGYSSVFERQVEASRQEARQGMRWLGRRSVLTVEKQFDRQSRNLRQMQIHGCQGRRGQLCADAVQRPSVIRRCRPAWR